jgi:hypothetical protein
MVELLPSILSADFAHLADQAPAAHGVATWLAFTAVGGRPSRFPLDLASRSPARTRSCVSARNLSLPPAATLTVETQAGKRASHAAVSECSDGVPQ